VPSDRSWLRRWAELGPLSRRSRQVLLLAALTGLLTGVAVAAFEFLVSEQVLARLEAAPLPVQALAPGVGLVLAAVALRYLAHGAIPETGDEYIRNFHDRHHRLDRRPVPGRIAGAVGTLSLGGALGYEGPSIYLGAAIGAGLQARLSRYFSREEAKTLMVAGAAAGLAAIFKAPATGAVFAIEVPYQDDLAGRMVLPALCASAVGYAAFAALRSTAPLLPIRGTTPFHLADVARAVVVGLVCGIGARLFTWGLRAAKRLADRGGVAVRVGAAAAALAALVITSRGVAGAPLTLGPGYRAITWATDPRQGLPTVAALLVLRAVATLATVEGGGVGGLFIPLVVEGALLGRLLNAMFGSPDSSLYPVLGIAAFLGAGYRTPLAAVTFVAETTGRPGFVVPGLIAAGVAQLMMGNRSVAPAQLPVRSGHLESRLRLPVSAALSTEAPTVVPTMTADDFMRERFIGQHTFVAPVVDESGRLAGVVDLAAIERVPRDVWASTTVAGVMRTDCPTGRLEWTLRDAVATMEEADVDVLPIVDDNGQYQGLLTTAVILALTEILDTDDDYGPGGPRGTHQS
jgi:CIC family chloride channel protein